MKPVAETPAYSSEKTGCAGVPRALQLLAVKYIWCPNVCCFLMCCSTLSGRGEFGEVFLAKAKGTEDDEGEALVLVKSLQTRDEQLQLDFKREAEMFGKLNHSNVVRLLGLCREAEPHYMILEYVDLVRALPVVAYSEEKGWTMATGPVNVTWSRLAAQGKV